MTLMAMWSSCSSPPGEAPATVPEQRAGHHPRRSDRQPLRRLLTLPTPDPDPAQATPPRPSRPLSEVLVVVGKLGTIAFGGPAVHVVMLRDETVRRRHWLEDAEFLDLFGAVSVLPGPSSTQLAIVLSRRRAGWAGLAIFLPSFLMVAAIEPLVGPIRRSAWAGAALDGVTMAALGLMAGVTVDLGRAAITDPLTALVAVATLVVVLRWRPNALWLVLAGALIGIAHTWPEHHRRNTRHNAPAGQGSASRAESHRRKPAGARTRLLKTATRTGGRGCVGGELGRAPRPGSGGRQACRTAPPPPGRQHPGADPG